MPRNGEDLSSAMRIKVLGDPLPLKDMTVRIGNVITKKLNIQIDTDSQQIENNVLNISSTNLIQYFNSKNSN